MEELRATNQQVGWPQDRKADRISQTMQTCISLPDIVAPNNRQRIDREQWATILAKLTNQCLKIQCQHSLYTRTRRMKESLELWQRHHLSQASCREFWFASRKLLSQFVQLQEYLGNLYRMLGSLRWMIFQLELPLKRLSLHSRPNNSQSTIHHLARKIRDSKVTKS